MTTGDSPILLYDGTCGFCTRSVQFVLQHESVSLSPRLRFAPLEGVYGRALQASQPWLATVNSVVWHEPRTARTLVRSDAALAVLRHLGGVWTLAATLGALVPRVVRDGVYDVIARHRQRLAGVVCALPTAEQSARFLS